MALAHAFVELHHSLTIRLQSLFELAQMFYRQAAMRKSADAHVRKLLRIMNALGFNGDIHTVMSGARLFHQTSIEFMCAFLLIIMLALHIHIYTAALNIYHALIVICNIAKLIRFIVLQICTHWIKWRGAHISTFHLTATRRTEYRTVFILKSDYLRQFFKHFPSKSIFF